MAQVPGVSFGLKGAGASRQAMHAEPIWDVDEKEENVDFVTSMEGNSIKRYTVFHA